MVEERTRKQDIRARAERQIYWRDHINGWQQSGQSKQAYCRAHGLNPASFYRGQGKLNNVEKKTPGFIPVRLPKGSPTYPIEVTLGNGVIVRLGNEADGILTQQLLRELVRGC